MLLFFRSLSPEIRKDKKTRKVWGSKKLGLIRHAYKKSACSHSFHFQSRLYLCVRIGVTSPSPFDYRHISSARSVTDLEYSAETTRDAFGSSKSGNSETHIHEEKAMKSAKRNKLQSTLVPPSKTSLLG